MPAALPEGAGAAGAAPEVLIPLAAPEPAEGEITVYVKGFLGRNEQAGHFDGWTESHGRARERLGWGSGACGLRWPAGRIAPASLPLPVAAAAKTAWDVYRAAAKLRRLNVVGNLAILAAEQLARTAQLFVAEYRAAERAAAERADVLAATLVGLRGRHDRVRLVAHSLGCRHAIEAIGSLVDAERPDEIHLCAPALREDDVAPALERLAAGRSVLYHASGDLVLRAGFALLSGGPALGAVGARERYAGLEAVDAAAHFDFWVHGEYKRRFGELAR